MNYFQCNYIKKRYFEGWYFKHQVGNEMIAMIPGINMDNHGAQHAFIQIITNEKSYHIPYSISDCRIDSKNLYIKIGNNIFSKIGVKINIQLHELSLNGMIRYSHLTPIRYPVMGIFRLFPRMECNHEIISMNHKLKGSLIMNGKLLEFDHGIGYIEKDWGHSFPSSYLWLQCNSFSGTQCSIMISIAKIPYLGIKFDGCLCVIHYKGMEYRLATYLGVKVLYWNDKEIRLQQGNYSLRISINVGNRSGSVRKDNMKNSSGFSHKLLAPNRGEMSRKIKEQNFCQVRYQFFVKNQIVFDLFSKEASLEVVTEEQNFQFE